ncbi:kelch repeat protein [Ancylostoma ceylanicum]|uniref:Kelch repeat protein n=1 Tax=Ancylostoma ceylanicum TaxID=53326 RepID=A0A0D6LAG5_9BILA|nr:kelch repeat protein [Ancylostoma ceylanicum]
MFTSNMLESKRKPIRMLDYANGFCCTSHISAIADLGIDYPTLSSLMEYAYGGSLTITEDSAKTVMAAASYLELLEVTEKCGIYICEHLLDAGNALVLRAQFSSLGCKTATMEVERFIDKNFVPISCTEKFLELSVEEVTELLSKDQLHVASEEEVFSAAMRWVEHSPVRTNMLERVLTCVRLHLLDRNFLVNEVARHPTIRGSDICREMVEDVKDFHLTSGKTPIPPLLSRPQRCSDCSWAIYVAGGRGIKKLLSTVEKYDPMKERWECVQSMPTSRAGLGLAVYDPKTNSWQVGVPMSRCLCADAVVVLDGYIYVLSGWTGADSISCVERFAPEIGRWEEMPKMGKERTYFGATAMNGKIYVCGG